MIPFHVRYAVTLFFETSCVTVKGRKLKIWYKEHIHNREYNWDE